MKRAISNAIPVKQRYYLKILSNIHNPGQISKYKQKLRIHDSIGNKININFIPPIFVASISMVCNLRCPGCLYLLKDRSLFDKREFIQVDDFKSIIRKYHKHIEILWLTGGEVFLHPDLAELLETAKSYKIQIKTSTNGVLIKWNEGLLHYFDYINVSLDGYDSETFKQSRGGSEKEFSSIMDSLATLREKDVRFSISFLLSKKNHNQVFKMIDFCKPFHPAKIIFQNINPHGDETKKPLLKDSSEVLSIFNAIKQRNDYPFDILLPVIFDVESTDFITTCCRQPWMYLCFDNVGNISYCCHLKHNPSIGNILNGYEFNSPLMKDFRMKMKNSIYPKDDCLFCHRRFAGKEYGCYSAKEKRWIY